ncbi:MAG: hypothetical protein R6V12_13200, partial [Candidatus Hydrogenedentota bacterium]
GFCRERFCPSVSDRGPLTETRQEANGAPTAQAWPSRRGVFVEHGLHGSSTAAPLAKGVIEYFYSHLPRDLRLAKAEEERP